VRILLAHEPQYLPDYAAAGVDLVFTGHAHGGQWRIPFTHQGLYAPDQGLLPDMTEGVFTEGGTSMVVSRGLGNSAFPLRAFNRPELIVMRLTV
jgi:predicted MPP superfamily phosphohydrolase